MAQEKAQNADVKGFAMMLVQDHSAVNDQVKSMASQKNIALPDSISADKKQMIDDLKKQNENLQKQIDELKALLISLQKGNAVDAKQIASN